MENQFFSYEPDLKSFAMTKPFFDGKRFRTPNDQTIHLVSRVVREKSPKFEDWKREGVANVIIPIRWNQADANHDYFASIDHHIQQAEKNGLWVVLDVAITFPDRILDILGFDLDTIQEHRGYVEKVAQTLFLDGANVAPQLIFRGKRSHIFLQHELGKFLNKLAFRYQEQNHVLGIKIPSSPEMGLLNHTKLKKEDLDEIIKGERLEKERRVWKDRVPCPWKHQNIWHIGKKDEPELLFKKHFTISKERRKVLTEKYVECAKRAVASARTHMTLFSTFPTHQINMSEAYPVTICGYNHVMKQKNRRGAFSYKFKRDARCDEKIQLFLPPAKYQNGFDVSFTSGKCKFDAKHSILHYYPGATKSNKIVIAPKNPWDPKV